jgi:hypothetical protein
VLPQPSRHGSFADGGPRQRGRTNSYDEDDTGPLAMYEAGEGDDVTDEDDEDEENPAHTRVATAALGLLAGVLPDEFLGVDLRTLAKELSKEAMDLIENAQKLEQQQREFWRRNLNEFAKTVGFVTDFTNISYLEEMQQKAVEILQRHVVAGPLGYSLVLRSVISGPARSGKTVFFSVIFERLLMLLDRCELRKRTFVMAVNCDHLAVSAVDLKSLYSKWIEMTLTAVIAQVPPLRSHQTILQKYFDCVVDQGYLSLLPKRFLDSPETQAAGKSFSDIATILSTHWNNPECGSSWASILFLFPILIAKELGFQDVVFLVDNFDSLNITLNTYHQFNCDEVQISEHFKSALESAQFVLSYHDSQEFENVVVALDDTLSDFNQTLEYHSVLDIECIPPNTDCEIAVDFGPDTIRIRSEHFGTAPGYVHQWNVLNELCDKLDSFAEDSDEAQECLAHAMTQAETILPLLFDSSQGFTDVDDVRRRKLPTHKI